MAAYSIRHNAPLIMVHHDEQCAENSGCRGQLTEAVRIGLVAEGGMIPLVSLKPS